MATTNRRSVNRTGAKTRVTQSTQSTKSTKSTKRATQKKSNDAKRRAAAALAPRQPSIARPMASFDYCRSLIRDVPDFPKPGIVFKDLTPLLASPLALHVVLDGIAERFIGEHIDAIVGIEARGFIFGGALAARLNAGFVPVRKPGKLPAAVDNVPIVTEYSHDALEMHKGSLREGARVVIVDDLLATGGTARAAADLVHNQGAYVIGYAFVVELTALGGRERLLPVRVESCVSY